MHSNTSHDSVLTDTMSAPIYKVEGAVSAITVDTTKAGHGSPFPMSTPADRRKEVFIEEEDARMRQCWDKTLRTEIGMCSHYTHVAVLIVHWARELDEDLRCWEEVKLRIAMTVQNNWTNGR